MVSAIRDDLVQSHPIPFFSFNAAPSHRPILDGVHKLVKGNSTSATKAGISANAHPRAEGCFGLLAVLGELAVSFAYSAFISCLPLLITSLLHSRPCVYVGFRGVLRATRRLRNEVPAWLCVVVGAWLEFGERVWGLKLGFGGGDGLWLTSSP